MAESNVKVRKSWLISTNPGNIDDFYDFRNHKCIIGQGSLGRVSEAFPKQGSQMKAVKIVPKNKIKNEEQFKAEVSLFKTLDHPNIVKLYEIFEDARNVYLVMELCEGGELFENVIEKGCFTELEARAVFSQLIRALNYCHSRGICHKDLKPENILLLNEKPDSPIKIIDFGLNKLSPSSTRTSTPLHISPEGLLGKYDESSDIWAAGVILYMLLSGAPPFFGNTDAQIFDAIRKCAVSFDSPEWKDVSDLAKDLIRKMLCSLDKRLKADSILKHPWFKFPEDKLEKPLKLNYQMLRNFRNCEKLKKVALTVIASQMSEEEINDLAKLFTQFDVNGDGVLTLEELKQGLVEINEKSALEIQEILNSIDTDQSGTINYTEFIAATMERSLYFREEKLWAAFRVFDKNGNGKISPDELKEVLEKGDDFQRDKAYYEDMIKEVDINSDGEVDYNEFIQMLSENKMGA